MMRLFLLPFAAWWAALQLGASTALANDPPRLIATAGVHKLEQGQKVKPLLAGER